MEVLFLGDFAIEFDVIDGMLTDLEGRHVDDDDRAGLGRGPCGVPGVAAAAGYQSS